MKQLQFLIKPAAGYCNMRCQYCFYRDEQQNCVNPDDCMMSQATTETLKTVRKYNQKHVAVQYAIQTNGLAITDGWADFSAKNTFS